MSKISAAAVLGRTGLEVTRLGYGAMEVRSGPKARQVTEDQVETVLNAVLDAGINFIDTSNDYGRSEEFIGKYISHRRSEYYLATKCGCPSGGGEHIYTRENLFRGLNESLQRLRTDHVDVIQLHGGSEEEIEQGNAVEVLEEMRRQGKVRWIGASISSLAKVPTLPAFLSWGVFDAFQIPYSALLRGHEAWIAESSKAGVGTIIRGGVAQGEPGEGRGDAESWRKFDQAKLDELRDEGESRTAFMLRLTLSHPQIDTIIVGTKDPEHLSENADAALRGPLPADVYAEALRRLDAVGLRPTKVQ